MSKSPTSLPILTEFSKNYPSLKQIKAKFEKVASRSKKRNLVIRNYAKSTSVTSFQAEMDLALQNAYVQTATKVADLITKETKKVEDSVIGRVKRLIDEEYGSIDGFLSVSGLNDFLYDAYKTGGEYASDSTGISAVFGVESPVVKAFLSDRSNFLIKSVDDTTKQELVDLFSNGYDSGLSWDQIATQIQDVIPDIASRRAEMIAHTESSNAFNSAQDAFYKDNNAHTKYWIGDSNPCPECQLNIDQGGIPYDQPFASGDDFPPAHPWCMCVEDADI